jgi:hypothetical protein
MRRVRIATATVQRGRQRAARVLAIMEVTHTVEHILALTLGPMTKNAVQVHFEGRRRQEYTNRPPTVIRIAGKCSLPVRGS